jgi:hypothetical protein
MSYEIEYTKKAFKAHSDVYNDDVYFAYVTHASNNVDPRTPRPMLVGIGMAWEIIQKVCVLASDCESGCLKPKNRRCSPESYIRRWREVLKAAPSLETLKYLRLKLTMKHDELKAYLDKVPGTGGTPDIFWRWSRIKELLESYSLFFSTTPHPNMTTWFDEKHISVEIPVKSYEDIKRAVELEHLLKDVSLLCWNIQIEGV